MDLDNNKMSHIFPQAGFPHTIFKPTKWRKYTHTTIQNILNKFFLFLISWLYITTTFFNGL